MGMNLTQPEEIDRVLMEMAGNDMDAGTCSGYIMDQYPLMPDGRIDQSHRPRDADKTKVARPSV